MAERSYTSAIDRLRLLSDIFTGGELTVRFGWKSAIASSYLAQWRKAGLVQSLGGRADVHMNLVQNPRANPEQALRRAFPTALKIGIDPMRGAGWTTQIAARPEIAIPPHSTRYQVDGFDLVVRPLRWFEAVKPGIEPAPGGIDALRPAWALADMVKRSQDKRVRSAWLPDPEDIDWQALNNPKTQKDLQTAWQTLNCYGPWPNGLDTPAPTKLATPA